MQLKFKATESWPAFLLPKYNFYDGTEHDLPEKVASDLLTRFPDNFSEVGAEPAVPASDGIETKPKKRGK